MDRVAQMHHMREQQQRVREFVCKLGLRVRFSFAAGSQRDTCAIVTSISLPTQFITERIQEVPSPPGVGVYAVQISHVADWLREIDDAIAESLLAYLNEPDEAVLLSWSIPAAWVQRVREITFPARLDALRRAYPPRYALVTDPAEREAVAAYLDALPATVPGARPVAVIDLPDDRRSGGSAHNLRVAFVGQIDPTAISDWGSCTRNIAQVVREQGVELIVVRNLHHLLTITQRRPLGHIATFRLQVKLAKVSVLLVGPAEDVQPVVDSDDTLWSLFEAL
jgi:hypothetical protein